MVFHGNTMETMLFHGSYPRSPYEFSMVQHDGHGIPWDFHGDHGIAMVFHGSYCRFLYAFSMERNARHGVLYDLHGIHGFSMENLYSFYGVSVIVFHGNHGTMKLPQVTI